MAGTTPKSAASPSLETLPLLVLETICEYLGRRSISTFSLVSRCCCSAASGQRFERVHFRAETAKQLHEDVEQWNQLLSIDRRSRYVRQVKVTGSLGYMLLAEVDGQGMQTDVDEAALEQLREEYPEQFELEDALKAIEDDGDVLSSDSDSDTHGFWKLPEGLEDFYGTSPSLPQDQGEQEKAKDKRKEAWRPIAHFIAGLPNLKDMTWACDDQMAICILSELHQHHPDCRLHVNTFSLRSLYQYPPLKDIDGDEFVLATSPCLHSIGVSYSRFDSDGRFGYNEEAVLQMVAASSPRLKSVCMHQVQFGDSIELRNAIRRPRPPWPGFFVSQLKEEPPERATTTMSKGALQTLRFTYSGGTHISQLTTWSNHTDFSKLRHLEIDAPLDTLQMLAQLASDGQFISLRTLTLFAFPINHQEDQHMDDATSLMLQNLPPLKNLGLNGHVAGMTFTTMLNCHAKSLRQLIFLPAEHFIFSHEQARQLQQCLNLEYVELRVPRTRGNVQEVAIYQALGGLSCLKTATLYLHCSRIKPSNENRIVANYTPSDIHETLANAAVDSSLAQSIFDTISSANRRGRRSTFHRLKLHVTGAGSFGQGGYDVDFQSMCRWIARSWVCRRQDGHGDDNNEVIIIGEIDKRDRVQAGFHLRPRDGIKDGAHLTRLKGLWSDVWPGRTGNWLEDWESFPLVATEEAGDAE
ncbi:hypothetical protein AJ80_09072 [Polytolypa hystricis UAMH7299]|uniref:F-box domain-containing protein n=1 Tax=Polytolypa hystricis (strain UAMH7299) TaxID=1447883 RepID=A0A2B7WWQ5_POLH7|nr:hypothetical protein AJ80_09072 [Polytolypa hystricis UAMH7299]